MYSKGESPALRATLLSLLQNRESGEQARSGHQLLLKQHQSKEEVLKLGFTLL